MCQYICTDTGVDIINHHKPAVKIPQTTGSQGSQSTHSTSKYVCTNVRGNIRISH